VLCQASLPRVQNSLDTVVFAITEKPLLPESFYTFECATQSSPCRITSVRRVINSSTLEVVPSAENGIESTHAAEVSISFDEPMTLERFSDVPGLGRFVLVKEGEIHGAGVV